MRTLRLLTLMISLAVISGSLASARTIDILKEDGGPNGYNEVDEYHDENYSSLSCKNPGWSACSFINPPSPKLVGYAEGQIAVGVYTGTHTEIIGSLKYTVTWQATSTGNAHIIETQDEIGTIN